jgi:hypothetical protein
LGNSFNLKVSRVVTTLRQSLYDGHPAPVGYGAHFENYLAFINCKLLEIKDTSKDSNEAVASNMVVRNGEDDANSGLFSLIECSLEKWPSRRRFCTTNQKGRLASVPPNSKNGNLICVIYGGEVPYVLRPHAPVVYTLVVECYVDGIMQREALSAGGLGLGF